MPPEVSHCYLSVSSIPQFFAPPSPKSKLNQRSGWKCCSASAWMKVSRKKLILLLVFILAGLSALRLLRFAIKTPSQSVWTPPPIETCAFPSRCRATPLESQKNASVENPAVTEKEFKYLSEFLSQRAPCNVLVFGLHYQYLNLSSTINAGGFTLFLEDNPDKLSTIRTDPKSTRHYMVEHKIPAREAYKMLKQARKNPACTLNSGSLEASSCPLALKLPRKVYEVKWDVVLVDGPSGDGPDAPGRMSAIYTARLIARSSGTTHVLVHDVDRIIEKWFSWEFLCEENLVSSKGKFWNFEITPKPNVTRFCSSC